MCLETISSLNCLLLLSCLRFQKHKWKVSNITCFLYFSQKSEGEVLKSTRHQYRALALVKTREHVGAIARRFLDDCMQTTKAKPQDTRPRQSVICVRYENVSIAVAKKCVWQLGHVIKWILASFLHCCSLQLACTLVCSLDNLQTRSLNTHRREVTWLALSLCCFTETE